MMTTGVNRDKRVDVVLIMCPGWGIDQPPVQTAYLKAFLEHRGLAVKNYDFSLELFKKMGIEKYWDLNHPAYFSERPAFQEAIEPVLSEYIADFAAQVLSHQPLLVGFSLYMSTVHASILLARKIKESAPEVLIVGGGAEASRIEKIMTGEVEKRVDIRDDIFKNAFDVLVTGEGELTLAELVHSVKSGQDHRSIKNILFFGKDGLTVNPKSAGLGNLDLLADPDFDDFQIGSYKKSHILPILTSRGCVNRCTFCADWPIYSSYREQSAGRVVKKMTGLKERYGVYQFEIIDSIFNGRLERVEALCDEIKNRGLKVEWSAKVSLRADFSARLLKKMKAAGCASLAFGVESGSQRVLDAMHKNTKIEDISRIVREAHEAGINTHCFFIVGYPTETEEDFSRTLEFIRCHAPYIHRFDQTTGCHIEDNSLLNMKAKEHGITFGREGWSSAHSSPQIRRERLRRIKELVASLQDRYEYEVQP